MKYTAVVPAKNEENKIQITLSTLKHLNLSKIIVVANGCTDKTVEKSLTVGNHIEVIYFKESLGVDIPRAVGALYALQSELNGILIVDADMTGPIIYLVNTLLECLNNNDMSLINCYPYITSRNYFVSYTLYFRELLNRNLNLFHKLGLASPSHGPHGLSKEILQTIPIQALAVPPLYLALAALNNFKIKVANSFPHIYLGSTVRNSEHTKKISHTIIGDCLEALCEVKNIKRSRNYMGIAYNGYNSIRRFDILEDIIAGKRQFDIYKG